MDFMSCLSGEIEHRLVDYRSLATSYEQARHEVEDEVN